MTRRNALAGHLRWYDFLPLGYVCTILFSQAFVDSAAVRVPGFYTGLLHAGILVGPPLYYICAFGPLERLSPRHVSAALMGSASVVGAMGIVEHYRYWTLWGNGDDPLLVVDGPPRIVATLSQPAVLGAFFGAAIVTATAILVWNGPRSLRRLAWVTLALTLPALLFTFTRGGIVATIVVASVLIAARPQARVIAAAVTLSAVLFAALNWSEISSSSIYQQRAADIVNIRGREIQAQAALALIEKRPVLGWGYGRYDEVKNHLDLDTGAIPEQSLYYYTSHNTFLTILVELGVVGLVLAFLPWLLVVSQTALRLTSMPYPLWFTSSLLGIIAVFVLTAFTTDMRFFSFVPALAWIAVGLLRRGLWSQASPA
jgi:O-antigen ligase